MLSPLSVKAIWKTNKALLRIRVKILPLTSCGVLENIHWFIMESSHIMLSE